MTSKVPPQLRSAEPSPTATPRQGAAPTLRLGSSNQALARLFRLANDTRPLNQLSLPAAKAGLPPVLQTKLTINQPGDEYEQEADRIASEVMRMPTPSSKPVVQRQCVACEKQDKQLHSAAVSSPLTISSPTDPEEQEAERIAGEVMRMPTSVSNSNSHCERSSIEVEKKLASSATSKSSLGTSSATQSYLAKVQSGIPASTLPSPSGLDGSSSSEPIRIFDDAASHSAADQLGAYGISWRGDIFLGSHLNELLGPSRNEVIKHEYIHALQSRNSGGKASTAALESEARNATTLNPSLAADPNEILGFWWVIPAAIGVYILLRPGVANAPAPGDKTIENPSEAQIVGEALTLFAVPAGVAGALGRLGYGVVAGYAISGAVSTVSYRGVQDAGASRFSGVEAYVVDATTGAVIGMVVGGVFRAFGVGTGLAGSLASETNPSLIHLTDSAGASGISSSGVLRGSQGIYALPESAASQGTAMRFLRTLISPSRTQSVVNIPEQAGSLFTRPTPIGPVSLYQRLMGVFRAPAGNISMTTGEFTTASNPLSNITGQFWPYGVDAMIWAGGGAVGAKLSPSEPKDYRDRGVFSPLYSLVGDQSPLPITERSDGPFVFVDTSQFGSNENMGRDHGTASPNSLDMSDLKSPIENFQQSYCPAVILVTPRVPDSANSDARVLNRKCASCAEEDEEKVHRLATDGPATAPDAVHQTLSQPGQPLAPEARAFFEPRFAADLSHVRIHDNPQAARSANAVNAKAYTVGQNIAFAAGQYSPHTESGKGLLAHELAHVMTASNLVNLSRATDGPSSPMNAPTTPFQPGVITAPSPTCAPTLDNPFCLPFPKPPCNPNTKDGKRLCGDPSQLPTPGEPCTPFDDRETAQSEWEKMKLVLPNLMGALTNCGLVKQAWIAYLDGSSTPFEFSGNDCVATAAAGNSTGSIIANAQAELLFQLLQQRLPILLRRIEPALYPLGSTVEELRLTIQEALNLDNYSPLFHPLIEYSNPFNAAGNLAGGVGIAGSGSDVFGDDDRFMSGKVLIQVVRKDPVTGVMFGTIRFQPHVLAKDTIDFCPGNLGPLYAQPLSITLSKLEASGLAKDVPITIDYNLNTLESGFEALPLVGPMLPDNTTSEPGTSPGQAAEKPNPTSATPIEYVIKPGDYLRKIAKQFYGIEEHWRPIYYANRTLIGDNPNKIFPGQELLIPPDSINKDSEYQVK